MHACWHAAATAARAAEVAEGGGAAALGVLVRVAKLEAALREEQARAAQARSHPLRACADQRYCMLPLEQLLPICVLGQGVGTRGSGSKRSAHCCRLHSTPCILTGSTHVGLACKELNDLTTELMLVS